MFLGIKTIVAKTIVIIILLLIYFTIFSCEEEEVENFETEYRIISHDGLSVEDYKENNPYYCVIPEIISFTSVQNWEGRVIFEVLGSKPIDRLCTDINCFIVDTKEEMYPPVSDIIFSELQIYQDTLKGKYVCAGSTIDYGPTKFIAIQLK